MSTQSRVWYFHAFFVVVWPIAALLAVLRVPFGGWLLFSAVGVLAAFGSLVGYFEEAKLFGEQGGDWVPRWKLWIGAHLLFSPFVTAPVYVARRWQKVGLRSGD